MAWDRLYSSNRWRKFSRLFLDINPVCVRCQREGQTQISEITHHLVEYRPGDSDLRFWEGPFEAVCRNHHLQAHGRAAMRPYSTAIGADGFPIDESHPFSVASRKQEQRR
jgi:5-methylcytosine-specific restriction enzyme A